MNKKIISLITILIFSLVALTGCGSSDSKGQQGASEDTIKIGFLGAKTGGHASYGIETLKGMQMAVEDLNAAGGLLGKEVVIIEGDHGSKNSEASTVTDKLINNNKVVAIVGDPTTGLTKIAAPIAQQNQVVLLSAGAVGTGVVEIGDFIFRDTLLDALAAPAVTKYCAEELGWKKVALVTSINNDYSVSLSKIFKDALGKYDVEIVTEQQIKDGDTNFSAQVTNLAGKEFDGIVFTGYYTEGGLFMKEVRKQGMDQVLVGGDGLLSPVLWEMGESAVEGSMVYTGFAPDPNTDNPKTKDFIEKYKANNDNKLPDMFSAQGYDAVMLIADAIKNAESADPKVFRDSLAQTKDWHGVTGTITIRENREPIKSPVYLLEVAPTADGSGREWKIKSAIPVTAE